jgi:acetyltransferase-like isoleucine patch superfamily enzyme
LTAAGPSVDATTMDGPGASGDRGGGATHDAVSATGADNRIDIDASAVVEALVRIDGAGNQLMVEAGALLHDPREPTRVLIDIRGTGNRVRIGRDTRFGGVMTIHGDGCEVDIGPACKLYGFFNLLADRGMLTVGEGTSMVQASVQLHEPGEVRFGRDCMVSTQVYVSLSDIHPIYDRASGARINPARSVSIGDHVWLGLRSMVMKGAAIGDGSIVAAGAMVTGAVPAHVIVGGTPARVLRRGVDWRRDFSEPRPEPLGEPARRGWFGRLLDRLT